MESKKILVVDDNAELRTALRHILAREGYDVTEAADGIEALHAVDACAAFDLVLVDIIMPNKEGAEVILDLRQRLPDIKIIAMSGGGRFHAFDPLRIALGCGANFVISKPFEPAALRDLVRMCNP